MEDPTPKKRRRRSRRKKRSGTPVAKPQQAAASSRRSGQPRRQQQPMSSRTIPKGQLPQNFIYGINPVAVALESGQLQVLYYDKSHQSERLQHIHAQAQADNIEIRPLQRQGWVKILPSAFRPRPKTSRFNVSNGIL